MAKIEVHAGDWGETKPGYAARTLFFPAKPWPRVERVPVAELAELEPASEENVKRLGGTVGWGLVGGMLLGPVGLLAGLLAGGNGKRVTFVARLKDGRKMLASTDPKTFRELQAAVFS